MKKAANIRVRPGGMERLRQIAGQFGAVSKSGINAGEASVSELLDRVISGELVIVERERAVKLDDITRDHLGMGATDQDVAAYSETLLRIAPAFGGDLEQADAWLWGSGAYGKRLDAAVCTYCGALVLEGVAVPEVDDDETWTRLAAEHTADCEWIRTRAHRVNAD